MSLMSKVDTLKAKAQQDGANELDLMRAALVESQERYNQQAAQISLMLQRYDKRIEALEAAMRASNTEKAQDYTKALREASETILGDVKGKLEVLKGEVQETVLSLQGARKQKEKNETLENIQTIAIVFVIVAAAFYVALLLYGWWYDIPEAVGKLDAVNNGIWQLLNRN